MGTRILQELVRDLENRRRLGDLPIVVLLGAGASVESGIEAMDGLFKLVSCESFAQFVDYIETRDDAERYRLLADFLQTRDPATVTPGYQALASLFAAAVFRRPGCDRAGNSGARFDPYKKEGCLWISRHLWMSRSV